VAHIMAFRGGGIVNVDDSSQVFSVADRGQSASTAVTADSAQLFLSGVGAVTTTGQDSAPVLSQAVSLPAFLQAGAAPQFVSVASVVTELQGQTSLLHGADSPGSGGGEIARGGESLAPMSLAWSDSSDNGWFIVPSAANEYGQTYVAANDGFAWDVAAGEFTVDFFFV
jgi:hypothetical protein